MTVDYEIGIGSGGVLIRQHVDSDASSSSTPAPVAAGNLTLLGTTFAVSKSAKAAMRAGVPPGPLVGGDPPGPLVAGNIPGPTGPAPGQIAIFGPIVVGADLLQK